MAHRRLKKNALKIILRIFIVMLKAMGKHQSVLCRGQMWLDLHFEKITQTAVWTINWNGAIL